MNKTKKDKLPLSKVQKTRQDILDVSARLFSQRGYHATSLRDIAAATNMKAGSLYYHFDSKEQLILEVLTIGIENIYENVIAQVNALPEGSPTRSILEAAATGHLEAFVEKGDYTSTSLYNYGHMSKPVRTRILSIRNKYEDLWRQWLEQAKKNDELNPGIDIKILRLSILSTLNRTKEWYHNRGLKLEDIARLQIGFFWDGVGR